MRVLIISFLVVLIDQVSKLFVKGFSIPFLGINVHGMNVGDSVPVINNFLNITFVENPGIAFGINLGVEYKDIISLFTLFASVGLVFYLYLKREYPLPVRISIALIIGGAFGNLIDRMFYGLLYNYAPLLQGKVVDFINISFFNVYIFSKTLGNYIFNIADASVTIGVILLMFALRKDKADDEVVAPEIPENYVVENKE